MSAGRQIALTLILFFCAFAIAMWAGQGTPLYRFATIAGAGIFIALVVEIIRLLIRHEKK